MSDAADLFSASEQRNFNDIADQLNKDFGIEVAAVTIDDVDPAAKDKYSGRREFLLELFNYWGVGDPETNNGLMFLLIKAPPAVPRLLLTRYPYRPGSARPRVHVRDGHAASAHR